MINEDIVAAAQYMDEHGKCVRFYEKDGSVCMMGALLRVITQADVTVFSKATPEMRYCLEIARQRLSDYAVKVFGASKGYSKTRAITYVNDYCLDTKEETVKFMMEAAEWEPNQ